MFCPKCGGKLPDGSKFCSVCGEKLTGATQKIQDKPKIEDVSVPDTSAIPVNIPNSDFAHPKKKTNRKKIIGIVTIAVVVIVAAAFGLKLLFFHSSNGNAYAYLSNGRYELITNLSQDQIIEIAETNPDWPNVDRLKFSPDGKYIYYYTDYEGGSGTLCQAEYGKLNEDSSQNDKYIKTIDTDVESGFRVLNNGSVIYEKSGDILYYFDGKESTKIAEDCLFYFTDNSENIVYATEDESGEDTLYGVKISDIGQKTKLASNVANIYDSSDVNNILYTKREDDDSETMYTVGVGKEEEKLAENVDYLTGVDDKNYFTAANGEKLHLYDFVEDTYAESDAKVTEPDIEDFKIPKYNYEMVSGSDLSESDFGDLYTTCTKALYWLGESAWNSYSMFEALDVEFVGDTDIIHNEIQKFIDKFASYADQDGYILVTDEVKAALKNIVASVGDEEWKWLWFCYTREGFGTGTDYDAYDEACEKWYEASDRIELRNELQNKENDYALQTLYCFEKGDLTTVNERILSASSYNGPIIFNTTDSITGTVNIENISSVDDVHNLFNVNSETENYIILSDGTPCQMSNSATEAFLEEKEGLLPILYSTNKEVYMRKRDGTLSMAAVNDGTVGDFTAVTDEPVAVFTMVGSTLYYTSDFKQSDDVTYCNLYSCNSGTSTLLANNIVSASGLNSDVIFTLYNDNVILAYTGKGADSEYELTMIDAEGKSTFISDNVTQYIRVDESTILFISDGDLYFYDGKGKEKKKIRNEVDWIWSQNSMEIVFDSLARRNYWNRYSD